MATKKVKLINSWGKVTIWRVEKANGDTYLELRMRLEDDKLGDDVHTSRTK